MWIICKNYLPSETTEGGVAKFLTYALDKSLCKMKPWADQYIFILDVEGVGYRNLDINQARKMVPIIQVIDKLLFN